MLQMARRGRRCLAKNTAVKRKLKNRAGNKHPLLFENRNELPFLFLGLLWLICFWDLGPLFRMTGRCVDFDLTALWYSEDEEKHQLPHNTVKKWALMDRQHSYLKLKSEHTPTHTHTVGGFTLLWGCRRARHSLSAASSLFRTMERSFRRPISRLHLTSVIIQCWRIGLACVVWARKADEMPGPLSLWGRPGRFVMGTGALSAPGQ